MRLHKITRRDRFYNQGDAYKAIPCYRKAVVPGDTHDIQFSLKFQTAAFSRNLLTDAMMSVFFFYVPNRLVWDQWTDFITQAEDYAGGDVPTYTVAWPSLFERTVPTAGNAASVLFRRAYKLCYNQYFGSDGYQAGAADAWYDDITDDTVVDMNDIKNTEQFTARLVTDGEIAAPTFDATTVPIDLNDFYRQMQSARSQRKANMSGDKYVDALRRMGVEPDWRIQNAPEFLGRADKDIQPIKTFNTTATGTGDSVARYEGTLEGGTGRKMFAEHGYIVGVAVIRPHIYNENTVSPPDGQQKAIEDFYLADNLRSQDTYAEEFFANANADDLYAQRFAVYRNGLHIYGAGGGDWANVFDPAFQQEAVFVTGNTLPVSDELGGDGIAFQCKTLTLGQTPVPANAV